MSPRSSPVLTNTTPGLERSWYAVALSRDVTDQPRQVQVLGRPWVVLRMEGKLVAFADRCPHRLAPLSIGTNLGSRLRCRYHGWEFDSGGICAAIPALGDKAAIPGRARLEQPEGLAEQYGLVWLAPAPPVCDLPVFAEWDDPAYDTAWNEPRRCRAGAGQLCDNFLDAAHRPVVHAGTFGVSDEAYLPPHDVVRDGWRASTTYRVSYRNHDDPLVGSQTLHKECWPATTALARLDFPRSGHRIAILLSCLPESATSTVVFKVLARNDLDGDRDRLAQSIRLEEAVLEEDLAVLESYPTMELPLDLRTEVHTRVDRLSTAYRRLLAELTKVA